MLPILLSILIGTGAFVQAQGVPGQLILDDARPITSSAGWGELAWSPDGAELSAHGPGGLWVLSLEGGEPQPVPAEPGEPIFRHRWPGAPAAVAQATAYAQRDDIWLQDTEGARRLTQGEDRFYDPVLSPDGQRVVFSGLVTGLHVMDLRTGALSHLGSGRWPSWRPDGSWLVFERDRDDGHRLTQADLLLWSPGLAMPLPLTASSHSLDRFPAFSPDGSRLAWVRDGVVHVAQVREVAP